MLYIPICWPITMGLTENLSLLMALHKAWRNENYDFIVHMSKHNK